MTMPARALLALLLVAACTPAATPPSSTTTSLDTTTAAPDPVTATYRYAPGSDLAYSVMVRQDITFDADGDAAGLGDETLPIDADLVAENAGTATYSPQEDAGAATTLRVSVAFPETQIRGTVNGDPVDDLSEGGIAVELGRIQPLTVTVVVDERGRIIADGSGELPVVGADLAALTGVTNDLFATPVGPEFPDRPVTVGDSWETTSERPGQSAPIAVVDRSRVIDHEDGTLTVETETTVDAYAVDFSRQFRDLFLSFAELEGNQVPPELIEQLDQIVFQISVDEGVTNETARFDVDRGVVTDATLSTSLRLTMRFRAPDEDGTLRGFEIQLDVDQTAVFGLEP